jgi:hypothetical protein
MSKRYYSESNAEVVRLYLMLRLRFEVHVCSSVIENTSESKKEQRLTRQQPRIDTEGQDPVDPMASEKHFANAQANSTSSRGCNLHAMSLAATGVSYAGAENER